MITLKMFKDFQISYSWATMYVARKMGLIKQQEIENFAVEYLSDSPKCKDINIIEIAYGVVERDFDTFLEKVVNEIYGSLLEKDGPMWNIEKRKLRYCLLKNLEINITDLHDHFQAYHIIYGDFGYPEDMWGYLYDVSDGETYTESAEENIKIQRTKLLDYLIVEKIKIDANDPIWPDSIYYPPYDEKL